MKGHYFVQHCENIYTNSVGSIDCCRSSFMPRMAYAAEIQMGSNGNLVFDPAELTIAAGDTVTVINGDLPPHNFVVADHPELSHPDLAFVGGESFDVTFTEAGDYEFQCEPHTGAGMKGVIHVT